MPLQAQGYTVDLIVPRIHPYRTALPPVVVQGVVTELLSTVLTGQDAVVVVVGVAMVSAAYHAVKQVTEDVCTD